MVHKEIIFLLRNLLLLCCMLFGLFFLSEIAVGHVTSVSQLSDVKRDHWAFQGLQRLVEKHGCENGYQDRTFRGDRAMPRYEFAAALNPCLDREIERLNGNTDIFNIDNEEQERSQKVLGFLDTRLRDQQRRSELLENRLRTLEINR